MRDRHIPRICRACGAPLARQEPGCWQCGASWNPELTAPQPSRAVVDATVRRDALEADRWADEGGRGAAVGVPASV